MDYIPSPATLAQRALYRASFILGMTAAMPYMFRMERAGDALTSMADRRLPDLDGSEDGSCLIASFGPYFGPTASGFRRHKLMCFLRGHWFPRTDVEAALAGTN